MPADVNSQRHTPRSVQELLFIKASCMASHTPVLGCTLELVKTAELPASWSLQLELHRPISLVYKHLLPKQEQLIWLFFQQVVFFVCR